MQNSQSAIASFSFSPVKLPQSFPVLAHTGWHRKEKPYSDFHLHDCLEIGYCHEGAGIFVIGEKVFEFRSQDAVVINHREMHFAHSLKGVPSKWTWIYLAPDRLLAPFAGLAPISETEAFCGRAFRNLLSLSQHPSVVLLIRDMIHELDDRREGYQDCVRSLVAALLAKLHRMKGLSSPSAERKPGLLKRLSPAFFLIRNRFAEKITIRQLANSCSMSPSNLRDLFCRATGKSPARFIAEYRMTMALSDLRNSDKKIFAVALDNGFSTLSSFNRAFRRSMKTTPKAWRKNA